MSTIFTYAVATTSENGRGRSSPRSEHFQAALALEPEFAWVCGLADAYILLADYSADSPSSVIGCARAAAKRALAIDPTLGEAEASLGTLDLDSRLGLGGRGRALPARDGAQSQLFDDVSLVFARLLCSVG